MDQHDKANKGNVTRTVTVVKGFARWGVRKFVGPKLKERALERTKKTEEITRRVPRKEIVKEEVPVYKNVPNHSKTSLQDITAKGEGTHYTGYENVAGGERLPQDNVLFEYQDKDAKGIDALKLKTKTMKKGKTPEQVAVEKTEEKQKKQEEIDNDMEGR